MGAVLRVAVLAVLVLDSVLLALGELLFLPLYLGSVPFPVTVLVAAVATPVLISWAAAVSPRGLVASAPLLAWFIVVFVVGFAGPGGDAVLRADWHAPLLLAAGALPGAYALGKVRFAAAARDG